jgi:dephospho-CoA kinase
VVEAFGQHVLDARGAAVDRAKLRAAIFGGSSDNDGGSGGGGGGARAASTKQQQQKAKLEGIVWPLVREAIEARIAEVQQQEELSGGGKEACVVVEAALLLEAGWADLCDEVRDTHEIRTHMHARTHCPRGYARGCSRKRLTHLPLLVRC